MTSTRKSLSRETQAAFFGLYGFALDKHIHIWFTCSIKILLTKTLTFFVYIYIYIYISLIRSNTDVYMLASSPPKRPFFLFLFDYMQFLNVLLAIAMFAFLAKT